MFFKTIKFNQSFSVPNEAMINKRAGRLITEFKELVFPDGYVPGQKRRVGSLREEFLLFVLTLLVVKLEHCGRIKSIPWLLMPWLLASPGHQQPWYWLSDKCILAYLWRLIPITYAICVEKWWSDIHDCDISGVHCIGIAITLYKDETVGRQTSCCDLT